MSTEEQRLEFMREALELAVKGAESIGAVMTVALLEFVAENLQNRAREDGAWNEERYVSYSRANEEALEAMAIRRHRGEKDPI